MAAHSKFFFSPIQNQPVSHFPCRILAYVTSSRSLLSFHPQNGQRKDQDAQNPKRRRKIASNNNFNTLCFWSPFIFYNTFSSATEFSLLSTLRLKITTIKFSLPATPTSTLEQRERIKRSDILKYFSIKWIMTTPWTLAFYNFKRFIELLFELFSVNQCLI